MNVLDTIKNRYSVRTYEVKAIENVKLKALNDYFLTNVQGPFGNTVRFKLVDATKETLDEIKKLVSYGNVKGSRHFIAGAVLKGEKAMEDFGYCMEKNILMATTLGLGTVWLGGSLNRSNFAKKLDAKEGEVIPAITPVGYAAEKRSIMDKVIRTLSDGKRRKGFGEIFFDSNFASPLDEAACNPYSNVLKAVQQAPSASNKQPWRILKEQGQNIFHFYLSETPGYNSIMKDVRMQNVDMGIAMCHFELAAHELSLKGGWHNEKPLIEAGNLSYIVSWKE